MEAPELRALVTWALFALVVLLLLVIAKRFY